MDPCSNDNRLKDTVNSVTCALYPSVTAFTTTIAGLRIFQFWAPVTPQAINQQVEPGRLYWTSYNMKNG